MWLCKAKERSVHSAISCVASTAAIPVRFGLVCQGLCSLGFHFRVAALASSSNKHICAERCFHAVTPC